MPKPAQLAQSYDIFSKFPDLPTEIRLKIWALSCTISRNVDLWSDFRRKEVENTIFYTQLYDSRLTNITPSAILHVSQESRQKALSHLTMEFDVLQEIKIGGVVRDASHPGFYANFHCETFIPRGNWNIISMEDFVMRRAPGQIRSLAIDITADFYKDLYKEYIMKSGWPFDVMEDIILYDATGLHVFKKGYNGGKVDLVFVKSEKPSSVLQLANDRLVGIFADMEQREITDKSKEIQGNVRDSARSIPDASFKRPCVRVMELVVRSSTV
jgi:hypothetical protein